MKKKLLVLPVTLASLLLSSITFISNDNKTNVIDDGWEGDPISYEKSDVRDFKNPNFATSDSDSFVQPTKVLIHYHNDDAGCKNRRFYTWVTGVDGVERKPEESSWTATDMKITLDYATLPEYQGLPSISFIVKVAGTWAGQSEDILVDFTVWQPDENGVLEIWTIPGEGSSIEIYKTEAETQFPKIKTAKFSDWKTITCEATEKPMYYKLYAYDKNYLKATPDEQMAKKQFHLFKTGNPTSASFDIKFNYTAKINVQYVIESEYASQQGRIQRIIVSSENLYENERFEKYYTYSGNDLGCTYTKEQTTFKVWAPTAAVVYVKLFKTGITKALGGSDASKSYIMSYQKGGVWSCTLKEDLKGWYYTYQVTNSSGTNEAMDPYAKACGLNGCRGYVYDSADTNPEGWENVPNVWNNAGKYDIASANELSVYEVHIRDLTMDKTWVTNKGYAHGTYNAFCESGTTYSDGKGHTVSTGFDHIKGLGVNAIQIIPVFDNDNDERPEKMKFNWGYNPLNYNCVDGGYSSDPTDPLARIREYKNVIMTYAQTGDPTRVIMDMVYNHVSSASSSCFTKIMPKYYFRFAPDWTYYDGSGCSNEVKSDATMMSKFIVDSLCWWAKEYKVKGFRFDLMELIDTWTLRKAKEALYDIDPDIVMYGEGWTSGGYHGKTEYSGDTLINGGASTALCYQQLYDSDTSHGAVGAFNDTSRNATKGGNDDGYNQNPYPQWGFVSQGSGDVGNKAYLVAQGMKGIHEGKGGNPRQTVNYVSCHDNYTLWDQLRYTLATNGYYDNHTPKPGGEPNTDDLVQASIACHSSVMMGNGIGFIQGGEELYRSKTYPVDELNKLREAGTVRTYPDYPHYSTDPEALIATADVVMFDNNDVVCHNSYKASDAVNSFKWDRKIAVNGVSTLKYNDVWVNMIKERNNLEHYDYPENCTDDYMSSWYNGPNNSSDGATVFATWLNGSRTAGSDAKGYYFVFANRAGGSIGFGTLDGLQVAFASRNDYSFSNYTLTLQPYTFVAFKKGY